MKSKKKNRRVCAKCKKGVLDIDHRFTNTCRQCGVTYCTECACQLMTSTTERIVCLSCLQKNAQERRVEMSILNRGW